MGKPSLGPSPAENLRKLREWKGVTLREVSHAVGIHHANLSKMEMEHYGIGLVSAQRLAKYFDVPVDALWPRESAVKNGYDFSEARGNPYPKVERKQVSLRLDTSVIDHFKRMSEKTGIPYQNLINLYLRECVHSGKNLSLTWGE
jgi:uncharacterized protein (DUF4415 family)